jgi:teichuronic acid biosynthesis glycosyltransferase TuaC
VNPPLRVLFITDLWPTVARPGAAPFVSIPVLRLMQRGHSVSVLLLRRIFPPARVVSSALRPRRLLAETRHWLDQEAMAPPLHEELVRVARYSSPPRPWFHHTWGRWAEMTASRQIAGHWTSFQPQVIHAHFASPSGWLAMSLSSRFETPYVVSVHGADINFTASISTRARRTVAEVLTNADCVIANSSISQQRVMKLCDGRVTCLRLWQGGDYISTASPIISNPLRILSVGDLIPSKGHNDAAHLLSMARQRGIDFRWTVVGRGSLTEVAAFRSLIGELGIHDRTTWIPELPNDGVLSAMSQSDVFLLLTKQDAYGVVFAEALSAGLLVIGSNRAGAILDFEQAGAPVVSLEPGATSRNLERLVCLLSNEQWMAAAKTASADWGRRNLGWDTFVDQLESIYVRCRTAGR